MAKNSEADAEEVEEVEEVVRGRGACAVLQPSERERERERQRLRLRHLRSAAERAGIGTVAPCSLPRHRDAPAESGTRRAIILLSPCGRSEAAREAARQRDISQAASDQPDIYGVRSGFPPFCCRMHLSVVAAALSCVPSPLLCSARSSTTLARQRRASQLAVAMRRRLCHT